MATPQHLPGTFSWFECASTDAAKAKDFYVGVFGWQVEERPMPEGMEGTYALFRHGTGDVAGLYQLTGPQFEGVPSHWATYVAVADVDASVTRAVELGGTMHAEPVDVPGVGRIAFVQDPTGATIGLFGHGDHPGRAVDCDSGNFGWSELQTRDPAAAKAFYTAWLGWEAKESGSEPLEYVEWLVGGRSIGGMLRMTERHGDAPPCWLPYVAVDDCDATAAKVTAGGGMLYVPPQDVPGVGRFCVLADPAGAVLAAIHLISVEP